MNVFIASVENNLATLTSEESWHCTKVLRKKSGDPITIIDGKGNFYDARLNVIGDKKCLAEVIGEARTQTARNYYLHLAIAPTKQIDRIEWMVEKAVEVGIDEISFVICKNSERTVIKTERIQKIVESAVKQSLQAYIPKINEAVDFNTLISTVKCQQKLIAHCYHEHKIQIPKLNFRNTSTLVLIGPEGDFTVDEVNKATKLGFNGLALGANRLRTETAGLYVCQAVSILSAD